MQPTYEVLAAELAQQQTRSLAQQERVRELDELLGQAMLAASTARKVAEAAIADGRTNQRDAETQRVVASNRKLHIIASEQYADHLEGEIRTRDATIAQLQREALDAQERLARAVTTEPLGERVPRNPIPPEGREYGWGGATARLERAKAKESARLNGRSWLGWIGL